MQRSVFLMPVLWAASSLCVAQTQSRPTQATTPPPPATKMEEFKPAAGTVVTVGYDNLPGIPGVSVDVREIGDPNGKKVSGLVVEVSESEYRQGRSFVDMDELPELLKGMDALIQLTDNPTQFKSFEVRYTTRGELQFTVFNDDRGKLSYAIQAGRGVTASKPTLTAAQMQKLRATFDAASQKLLSLKVAK